MAERDHGRLWRQLTYGELLIVAAHCIGAAPRAASPQRSPSSFSPAIRSTTRWSRFGALYAGIPFCPVSPAYSLVSKDYGKLAYLMKLRPPVWVRRRRRQILRRDLRQRTPDGTEIAAADGRVSGRDVTVARRSDWPRRCTPGSMRPTTRSARHDREIPCSRLASTGNPKAVINTQRMICANQMMIRETMAFLRTSRRSSSTGCRGITPLAATTISG